MNPISRSRRILLTVVCGSLMPISAVIAQSGGLFQDNAANGGANAVPAPMTPAPVAPAPGAKPVVPAAPATQPSVDAVQAAIDAKDYSNAVKLAAKVLALKGPAAAGISRFQVIMMKGDAQAGMKSISAAVMTYKSAMNETKDVKEIALARWTAELFHTAGSNVYTPKMIALGVPKRGPFDLMVPEQRKAGFGALLEDNLSALDPKIKTATVSQSLPQIWPVLQQVIDLAALDEIANGSDDKTNTVVSSLLDHSRNLLSNALKQNWARLGDIDSHANQTVSVPTQQYVNGILTSVMLTRKNGLSQSNKTELNNMIALAQKIRDAAGVFMNVAKTDQGWSTIQSDADRVASKASDVLAADYGTTVGDTTSTDLEQPNFNGNQIGGIPGNQVGVIPGANQTGTGINGGGVNAQVNQQVPPPKTSNAPSKPNTGTNNNKNGKGTGTGTGTGN